MAKSKLQPKEGVPVSEVREQLYQEAEMVMATSVPTPTQADMDKIVTGEIGYDDKEANDPPAMPPLETQQAMVAAAEDDEQLVYRTQRPVPPPDEKPPPEPPLGGSRSGPPTPRPQPATQPKE